MKRFLNKKVRILGRSVSLTLILAMVLTTVVFAGWIILMALGSAVVSTATVGPLVQSVAVPWKDTPTSTCGFQEPSPGVFEITWTGARVNEHCGLQFTIDNDGPHVFPLITELVSDPRAPLRVEGDYICGDYHPYTDIWEYRIAYILDPILSSPGETYDMSFELTYDLVAPVCP